MKQWVNTGETSHKKLTSKKSWTTKVDISNTHVYFAFNALVTRPKSKLIFVKC